MLRKDLPFKSILTKIKPDARDGNIYNVISIKHESIGESQHFLDSFSTECDYNCLPLFRIPVEWNKVGIETDVNFSMKFDELEFDCKLIGIGITRKYKKEQDVFTYTLNFEMVQDNNIYPLLSHHLNYKEKNQLGKEDYVLYPVELTLLK